MKLKLSRSWVACRKRYHVAPSEVCDHNVDLDEAEYWGLLQVAGRTSRNVQTITREALRDYFKKWRVDIGMEPPRVTWRERLALWILHSVRK